MKSRAAILDEAAQEWLECYDAHRKFIVATKKRFCAFAAGWDGPRRSLMEAFETYREALLASEVGFNHLEVAEVRAMSGRDID